MFVLGMFSFGCLVGFICGVSMGAGVSQTLLTSVFTFVAGSVLALAGFREQLQVFKFHDTGVSLFGFSIGAMSGILGGIIVKYTMLTSLGGTSLSDAKQPTSLVDVRFQNAPWIDQRGENEAQKRTQVDTHLSSWLMSKILPQTNHNTICDVVQQNLSRASYNIDECKNDLGKFHRSFCQEH